MMYNIEITVCLIRLEGSRKWVTTDQSLF